MAEFTIELSSGLRGRVRQGVVRKISQIFSFLKRKSSDNAKRKGYIVTLELNKESTAEYRLLKTFSGEWVDNAEAGFERTDQDQISIQIQEAIDKYEKRTIEQTGK